MRRFLMVFLVGIMLLALSGCGNKEEYTSSFLEIAKDGSITAVMVEDFKKSFYDLEALEDMIRLEIAQYNAEAGQERITLTSLKKKDDNVIGIMEYKSAEDYAVYNEVELFIGTIKEASEKGIDLNISLVDNKTEEVIGEQELLKLGSLKLVMWNEKIEVRTSGNIMYFGDNLKLLDKKQIVTREEGESPFYLVFK